jgi:hypothetical protein
LPWFEQAGKLPFESIKGLACKAWADGFVREQEGLVRLARRLPQAEGTLQKQG